MGLWRKRGLVEIKFVEGKRKLCIKSCHRGNQSLENSHLLIHIEKPGHLIRFWSSLLHCERTRFQEIGYWCCKYLLAIELDQLRVARSRTCDACSYKVGINFLPCLMPSNLSISDVKLRSSAGFFVRYSLAMLIPISVPRCFVNPERPYYSRAGVYTPGK